MTVTMESCPFCGSEAMLSYLNRWKDNELFRVSCKSLSCDIYGPIKSTEAEAVTAWNIRSPDKDKKELLETLEAALGIDILVIDVLNQDTEARKNPRQVHVNTARTELNFIKGQGRELLHRLLPKENTK